MTPLQKLCEIRHDFVELKITLGNLRNDLDNFNLGNALHDFLSVSNTVHSMEGLLLQYLNDFEETK